MVVSQVRAIFVIRVDRASPNTLREGTRACSLEDLTAKCMVDRVLGQSKDGRLLVETQATTVYQRERIE